MWQIIKKEDEFDYLIDYPKNYETGKKYPVLNYLHGMGNVGKGVDRLATVCPVKRDRMSDDMPFIIVAPACDEHNWIIVFERLQNFISKIINSNYADKNRIYLCGSSMGGYTCWNLLIARTDIFAASVICCGGGMYFDAPRIKTPVIAVHGNLDTTVLPRESVIMAEKINENGGSAKLILHDDLSHDVWSKTFTDKKIYKWLLNKHLFSSEG